MVAYKNYTFVYGNQQLWWCVSLVATVPTDVSCCLAVFMILYAVEQIHMHWCILFVSVYWLTKILCSWMALVPYVFGLLTLYYIRLATLPPMHIFLSHFVIYFAVEDFLSPALPFTLLPLPHFPLPLSFSFCLWDFGVIYSIDIVDNFLVGILQSHGLSLGM